MKKIVFIAVAWLVCHHNLGAQVRSKKTESEPAFNYEGCISARDSAYADPRIAIDVLMEGNKRFVDGKAQKPRQDKYTVKSLEKGQHPFAVIVGCSDSRVPNELIFDQGFGDLFIIRTAGQVAADASYASMEFATLKLGTKLIVVMGHTECGAVAASLSGDTHLPGHLNTLTAAIRPAVLKSQELSGNPLDNAVRQNVIDQVNALRKLAPILDEKFKTGELLIVGAVYDIHTGKVTFLEQTIADLPVSK
ncbi:carbonic anhydrase [Flavobacterium sp.]|uniref:carbonic anhydrase n=1 Tax=Flavobacterium sp. TaxID=239 RepID=UPI00260E62C7|nr:carbonic anhydrase [Flavobacterium sp.]